MESIYIAGPLTTSGDRFANRVAAEEAAAHFLRLGYAVFYPHLYDYLVVNRGLFLDYSEWMEKCLYWLDRCDFAVFLPGWEKSEGAVQEYRRSVELGKVIIFWDSYCQAKEAVREAMLQGAE